MYTPVRSVRAFRHVTLGVGALAVLGLTACSSDSGSSSGTAAGSSSSSSSSSPETSAQAVGKAGKGTAGAQPEWANPVTATGTSIATVDVGDLTVEVFQVGTATAQETGFFVDPDTDQPLIAVGDTLVFLDYVVTNNGAPVDLGASLVTIDATYDDWPYLGGMDGLSDRALFEAQGVNADALASGAYRDPSVYTFGTGQSYSVGDNFEYQPGSPITFDVDYTPVDAAGELLHDQRVEATGTGTIA